MFGEKNEFFIFNRIYHDYNKNCAFYQKMFKIRFIDFFEMNNFVPQHYFLCLEFLIFNNIFHD